MKKNTKKDKKAIKEKIEYKPQREYKKNMIFSLTDTFSYKGKVFSVLI